MISRRGFFSAGLASLLAPIMAWMGMSAPDVPRRLSARTGWCSAAILIYDKGGKRVNHCVEYDLDADTATVLALDPNGSVLVSGGECIEQKIRGFSVQWDREQLRKERRA